MKILVGVRTTSATGDPSGPWVKPWDPDNDNDSEYKSAYQSASDFATFILKDRQDRIENRTSTNGDVRKHHKLDILDSLRSKKMKSSKKSKVTQSYIAAAASDAKVHIDYVSPSEWEDTIEPYQSPSIAYLYYVVKEDTSDTSSAAGHETITAASVVHNSFIPASGSTRFSMNLEDQLTRTTQARQNVETRKKMAWEWDQVDQFRDQVEGLTVDTEGPERQLDLLRRHGGFDYCTPVRVSAGELSVIKD